MCLAEEFQELILGGQDKMYYFWKRQKRKSRNTTAWWEFLSIFTVLLRTFPSKNWYMYFTYKSFVYVIFYFDLYVCLYY